jgi:hypothetical protein
VVSQFDTLDPDFNLAENLLVYGRYFGMKDAAIRARIPRLLEFAALSHKAEAKPGELSGGMKRRLSLARALVNDPQPAAAGRAHHRAGPAGAPPDVGAAATAAAAGQVHPADHPLHGRGRAPVPPPAGAGPRPQDRRRPPRDLIAEHLEPDVVEVYGVGALALAQDAALRALAARVEVSGETVFFYTAQARPLLAALEAHPAAAHAAPAGESGGPVPQADRAPDPGGRLIMSQVSTTSVWRAPRLSMRWWPVFLRNLLVWRKLAIPSLVGNIAEPLMWLVAFGYGWARWWGRYSWGRRCPTSCSWPAAASA